MYVGMATTTLSNGPPANRTIEQQEASHNSLPTRQMIQYWRELIKNQQTLIPLWESDYRRLRVAEAVIISQKNPSISIQLQPETILPPIDAFAHNRHLKFAVYFTTFTQSLLLMFWRLGCLVF